MVDIEIIYDAVDQKPNTALKPTAHHTHSQTASTTKQKAPLVPPAHYTVDSDHYYEPQPHVTVRPYDVPKTTRPYDMPKTQHKNQRGAKKPMVVPQHAQSAASMQKSTGDGVYMALDPSSLMSNQQSWGEQQYMTPKGHGVVLEMEEPQYMNSVTAIRQQ